MGAGVMTLEIRPFSPEDIGSAVVLEAASQPKPWTEQIFIDEVFAENRAYLAADDDGLVGFGGVMVVGDEAHITNLLVAASARRQGIGTRLMSGLVESALGLGARHLRLEVQSNNRSARGLYARFGLAPVGVDKNYYGEDDALIMWVHDIDSPEYSRRLSGLR